MKHDNGNNVYHVMGGKYYIDDNGQICMERRLKPAKAVPDHDNKSDKKFFIDANGDIVPDRRVEPKNMPVTHTEVPQNIIIDFC